MTLEFLERHSGGDGPLHRLDARVKLVATVAFVVAVVATPLGSWNWLAVEGLILAFVIGLSGVSPRALFARWLGFLALVGFLACVIASSHPRRAEIGAGSVALAVLAKNSLAFLAMLVLAGVTPFPKLLTALCRLRVPVTLVATLQLMYRYLHVFTGELGRMAQARRSRTFGRPGRLDWNGLTGLIGALFLRAFERGERVHAAMLARGWDGAVHSLDGTPARIESFPSRALLGNKSSPSPNGADKSEKPAQLRPLRVMGS